MVERNVFGEPVSRAARREMARAAKRRAEIVAAHMPRRELLKNGLLSASGYLVAKRGLSSRWASVIPTAQAASPRVTPFVEPLPIMPIKTPVDALDPMPAVVPNRDAG